VRCLQLKEDWEGALAPGVTCVDGERRTRATGDTAVSSSYLHFFLEMEVVDMGGKRRASITWESHGVDGGHLLPPLVYL